MRVVAVVTVVAVLAGCAARSSPTEPAGDSDRWRATDEAVMDARKRAAATKPTGRFGVTHVVLCWLKTPGDAAQRKQLIETAHSFHNIPGLNLIAAGTPVASTRPVVDSSFDIGFVMMFEDEAAMHAYEAHPQHREAVSRLLRPLTQRIQVYDFRNERPGNGKAAKQ